MTTNKMANPCVLYEYTSTSDPELGNPESEDESEGKSGDESEVDEDNENQDNKHISWLVLGTTIGVPIVTLTICLTIYFMDKCLRSSPYDIPTSNRSEIYFGL